MIPCLWIRYFSQFFYDAFAHGMISLSFLFYHPIFSPFIYLFSLQAIAVCVLRVEREAQKNPADSHNAICVRNPPELFLYSKITPHALKYPFEQREIHRIETAVFVHIRACCLLCVQLLLGAKVFGEQYRICNPDTAVAVHIPVQNAGLRRNSRFGLVCDGCCRL